MNKKFVISLIGAPASGKGYIASSLVKELKEVYGYKDGDIADISVGEMIRREKKANTALGQKLAANMKEGGLAPDDIVNDMLREELKNVDAKVLVLDGYPRTVGQVKTFAKLMEHFNGAVIFRDTPKELILERVKNRRICEKCGKAHDVGDGICSCGGRLIKRKDDEVLPERLAEYEAMTKPAVMELKKEGKNFFWYEGTAEGEDIAREFLAANKQYLQMSIAAVRAYFKQCGIESRILEFDVSSATVELAAAALGCEPCRIAKTLSFDCNGETLLIVTAGDCKVDNAKYKQYFHCKAKMLRADEAPEKTGHAVGGICPFANPEGVKVCLDVSLKRFRTIFPACGSSNSAIELTPDELEQYARYAVWIDVCKLK